MTNHNPTLNKRVLYMFRNPLQKIIGTSLYSCLNKYRYTISEIDHKNFNSNLIFIQRNKLGYSLTSVEIKQSYPITIAAYCHTSGTQHKTLHWSMQLLPARWHSTFNANIVISNTGETLSLFCFKDAFLIPNRD